MDRRNIAALVYVIALHFAGISLPIVSPLIDAVVPSVASAPVKSDGFRVLIVEDVAARHTLPKEQEAALLSTEVSGYLNAHCVKSPSGQSEWRRLDAKATIADSETPFTREAMNIKRDSLPWLYAANGRKFFNGPYPKDVDSTLATLRKVGGQ